MGLLDKLKKAASWVGDKIDKGATWVAEKTVQVVETVGAAVEAVGNYVYNQFNDYIGRNNVGDINVNSGGGHGGGYYSGDPNSSTSSTSSSGQGYQGMSDGTRKALINERNKIVYEWQNEVAKDAEFREGTLKDIFLNMYKAGLLNTFSPIFDTSKLVDYVEKQSKCFDNVMRDEINNKVTPGELKRFAEDFGMTEKTYEMKVKSYARNVYNEAKRNIEDLFIKLVNETNEYIKNEAEKYLHDENEVLKQHQETLVNLSADGEKKEKQLIDIIDEISTMTFIKREIQQ